MDELRGEARTRGGDIQIRGSFAAVDGDEVLLRQALSNLLRNAIEACTGAKIAPQILLEGHVDEASGLCRITVSDNGPGIEVGNRERIFNPFFTTKPQGTGLGLALVQKIVVTHNGRVTAANSPSGGASLSLTLPMAARA